MGSSEYQTRDILVIKQFIYTDNIDRRVLESYIYN